MASWRPPDAGVVAPSARSDTSVLDASIFAVGPDHDHQLDGDAWPDNPQRLPYCRLVGQLVDTASVVVVHPCDRRLAAAVAALGLLIGQRNHATAVLSASLPLPSLWPMVLHAADEHLDHVLDRLSARVRSPDSARDAPDWASTGRSAAGNVPLRRSMPAAVQPLPPTWQSQRAALAASFATLAPPPRTASMAVTPSGATAVSTATAADLLTSARSPSSLESGGWSVRTFDGSEPPQDAASSSSGSHSNHDDRAAAPAAATTTASGANATHGRRVSQRSSNTARRKDAAAATSDLGGGDERRPRSLVLLANNASGGVRADLARLARQVSCGILSLEMVALGVVQQLFTRRRWGSHVAGPVFRDLLERPVLDVFLRRPYPQQITWMAMWAFGAISFRRSHTDDDVGLWFSSEVAKRAVELASQPTVDYRIAVSTAHWITVIARTTIGHRRLIEAGALATAVRLLEHECSIEFKVPFRELISILLNPSFETPTATTEEEEEETSPVPIRHIVELVEPLGRVLLSQSVGTDDSTATLVVSEIARMSPQTLAEVLRTTSLESILRTAADVRPALRVHVDRALGGSSVVLPTTP